MTDFPNEFKRFVKEHGKDDPAKLRLKYHGSATPWIGQAISHIECLRKCGRKFGSFQPELMLFPLSVEQATSEKVALLHASVAESLIESPVFIVDMTCGLGIDLKAISQRLNCRSMGFDIQPKLASVAQYNFRNDANVEIIAGNSVEWLTGYEGSRIDLIFIDPARRGAHGEKLYNIHDCNPDVSDLLPLFREKCRYTMVKLSPMLDVTQTLRDLPDTKALYVVDEGGECRELLAVLDFTTKTEAYEIIIWSDGKILKFNQVEEDYSTAIYSTPEIGQYLYEPSPAAMKALPSKLLCEKFGLRKLHVNTHLFSSGSPVESLPGKWYLIEEIDDVSSSKLKEIGRRIGRADVAVRNFPITPETLTKKLGIKSGGDRRVICCTVGGSANKSNRGVLLSLRHHFF